jgi:hypothetical protein
MRSIRAGAQNYRRSIFGLVVLIGIATTARAEDTVYPEGRVKFFGKRYSIFVGTGFYRPSTREAREVFGSFNVRSAGLASRLPFEAFLYRPKAGRGPTLDFGLLWKSMEAADGDRVRVISPTAGLRAQLVNPRRGIVPFVSVQVGPYFARTTSGTNLTYAGGNATVGFDIHRRAIASVRYDLVERNSGGMTFRLAFKAF